MQQTGDILVVDDDQPTVDFLFEVLSEEGYTVRAALDAAHAREAIIGQHPDLVLLDLRLPGKDGDVLVRDLQSDGLADVPVILMTADAPAAKTIEMDGIASCLLKPFTLDDLFQRVAQHIRPRRCLMKSDPVLPAEEDPSSQS
jgi:DNA-binding response OmpR family regulator